jgi:hypothetical protein
LIFVRPVVEALDDQPFEADADRQHEEAGRDRGEQERMRRLQSDEAGIGAKREQRPMREVEHAERAQDDGEAAARQCQKQAESKPVEGLGEKRRQAWHGGLASGGRFR